MAHRLKHKPNELYSDERRQYIYNDYPEAFCDFYGTPSGAPCLYRTGSPWSKPKPGPEAYRHVREMRPVHNHPIKPHWIGFLRSTEAYLLSVDIRFNAIAGVAMSNKDRCMADEGTVGLFSPLVVLIGVAPCSVTFQEAKAAAEHIKNTILGGLGFGDVDVAIREWSTSLCARGPTLPSSFEKSGHRDNVYIHPFTSMLGLRISPYAYPTYEGIGGLYLRRENGGRPDIILITAAHVVRPPGESPNTGTPHSSEQQRQDVVYLGNRAFAETRDMVHRMNRSHEHMVNVQLKGKITRLSGQLQRGDGYEIPERLRDAKKQMKDAKEALEIMKQLVCDVSERSDLENRIIGHILHSDPIGPGPGMGTLDWAAIKLEEDMFDWENFKGNSFFVGDGVNFKTGNISRWFNSMYPDCDQSGSGKRIIPYDGVIQVTSVVPAQELQNPTRKDAHGNLCFPVLKNGNASGSGTTFGWLNGLETLVHYHMPGGVDFTAIEATFLANDPDENSWCAFSRDGDSGSTIIDGEGRIVAMIHGGSGSSIFERHDLTYATPFHLLQKRIKEVLPDYSLYPGVGIEGIDFDVKTASFFRLVLERR
ncbi:hypothetical protein BKA70DRAFT_1268047 [Coprinopsis sp. MPI-PUGE-AT-0042]|nr:hypothetical protein BKA70DRAFT_1268047 [Coprinopsis sp. MPI-PUGE-AT-0042]